MKKIFSWAIIMLTAMIGMTACSSDDNENENKNKGEFPLVGNTSMPEYKILSKNTYTKDEYKALLLKGFQKYIGSNASVEFMVNYQLGILMNTLPAESKITIVNFDCPSAGYYSGTRISGQIIVPTLDNKLVKDTLVLDNRFTQLKNSEVPTNSLNVGAVIASTGCPVVTCDMLGYGSSKTQPLNYHCYHYSSRNTIDAAMAGIAILHGPELGLDISDEPLPVYNEGYSQGGYGALSVLKYLETDDATAYEKQQLPILKTVCGAGAYDPTEMLRVIRDRWDEVYPYYCYVVAAMETAFTYHPGDYKGYYNDKHRTPWQVSMENIFMPEVMKSSLIRMTTNRLCNTSEIMDKFFEEMGGKDKCIAYHVFHYDFFRDDNIAYLKVMEKGKKESLVEDWVPKSSLHFYHARNDEAVPVECARLAKAHFGEGPNKNISYDIDKDVTLLLGMLQIDGLQPHTMGYFNFMIQTVLEDLKAKPADK